MFLMQPSPGVGGGEGAEFRTFIQSPTGAQITSWRRSSITKLSEFKAYSRLSNDFPCPIIIPLYDSFSQPLWDRGPVNYFYIRRGPGPNRFTRKYVSNFVLSSYVNLLTPNGNYMVRTAQLTSRYCILYIYSTNIRTEYFKHVA